MTPVDEKSRPTYINLRFSDGLRQRLEKCAERNNRPLAREAEVAIRQYVEREESETA